MLLGCGLKHQLLLFDVLRQAQYFHTPRSYSFDCKKSAGGSTRSTFLSIWISYNCTLLAGFCLFYQSFIAPMWRRVAVLLEFPVICTLQIEFVEARPIRYPSYLHYIFLKQAEAFQMIYYANLDCFICQIANYFLKELLDGRFKTPSDYLNSKYSFVIFLAPEKLGIPHRFHYHDKMIRLYPQIYGRKLTPLRRWKEGIASEGDTFAQSSFEKQSGDPADFIFYYGSTLCEFFIKQIIRLLCC